MMEEQYPPEEGSSDAGQQGTAAVAFSKMSGHGNDFIIMDSRGGIPVRDWPSVARNLCDRRRSIGADGLLLVEESEPADFRLRIFNADGSEADMCGNGARCIAVYAVKKGVAAAAMTIETGAGLVTAIVDGNTASIKLPGVATTDGFALLSLDDDSSPVRVCGVDSGVPHAVVFIDADDRGMVFDKPLKDVSGPIIHDRGRILRYHPRWGDRGANVDFVEVVDGRSIYVRTYERGVEAETRACGTGAVAAAFAARQAGYVAGDSIAVHMPGGLLSVFFQEEGEAWVVGPVVWAYEGVAPLRREW